MDDFGAPSHVDLGSAEVTTREMTYRTILKAISFQHGVLALPRVGQRRKRWTNLLIDGVSSPENDPPSDETGQEGVYRGLLALVDQSPQEKEGRLVYRHKLGEVQCVLLGSFVHEACSSRPSKECVERLSVGTGNSITLMWHARRPVEDDAHDERVREAYFDTAV